MKKIFVALCMVAFLAACDDSSSTSAGQNDEPGVESSSSSRGKVTDKVGEPAEPAEEASSSSEKAKSSSSKEEKESKASSSSVKLSSSSSVIPGSDTESSSSVAESSSSVEDSSSSEVTPESSSSETESSSSSSENKINCSAFLEGKTGWNWDVPKECRFNPDIDYGSIIDSRDGKVYRTVKIGDQVWMAENLNFDPGRGGSGENEYEWSWCYGDEPEKCDVAGRLYTWAAAMDSVGAWSTNGKGCGDGKTCTLTTTVQGICPEGWHLPSFSEWYTLFTAVGGSSTAGAKLKSQTGWNSDGNGTDAFGFSALPAGLRGVRNYDVYFLHDGGYADVWSSTENSSDLAYGMLLDYIAADAGLGYASKGLGLYVRCLRD